MPKLTVTAHIEAKKDKIKQVKSELLKIIEITKKENGCLQYNLHQDNNNEEIFVLYEKWDSKELWQSHMSNAHIKEYIKKTDKSVINFTLNEMTQIA